MNFKELGKGLGTVILYLVIIPMLVGLGISIFYKDLTNINLALLNVIIYLFEFFIIFWIYRKSLIDEWYVFTNNWQKFGKVALKNWLKGFLLMILFNTLILLFFNNNMPINEQQNREFLQSYLILSVIAMIVLGPILEEIVFRKGFKKAFKNKQGFLIFTAFLFGLGHVISNLDFANMGQTFKELAYILPYGSLGYFFGNAYYETDCIYTSMISHIFHNALTIGLILILN